MPWGEVGDNGRPEPADGVQQARPAVADKGAAGIRVKLNAFTMTFGRRAVFRERGRAAATLKRTFMTAFGRIKFGGWLEAFHFWHGTKCAR